MGILRLLGVEILRWKEEQCGAIRAPFERYLFGTSGAAFFARWRSDLMSFSQGIQREAFALQDGERLLRFSTD